MNDPKIGEKNALPVLRPKPLSYSEGGAIYEIQQKADAILEEATARAEVKMKNANAYSAKIIQKAQSDLLEAKRELGEEFRALNEALERSYCEKINQLERGLGSIVTDICKKILHETPDEQFMQSAIKSALNDMHGYGEFVLVIHPSNFEIAKSAKSYGKGLISSIEHSDAIKPGSCELKNADFKLKISREITADAIDASTSSAE